MSVRAAAQEHELPHRFAFDEHRVVRAAYRRQRVRHRNHRGMNAGAHLAFDFFRDREQLHDVAETPRVGDVYRVGDSFSLQFVEPQLMLSVTIRASLAATNDSDIGNPYWCGPHLAAKFGAACGA